MKKVITGLCTTLAVSGCMSLAPIKEPPVKAALMPNVDQKRLAQGTTNVAIRSFVQVEGEKKTQEVIGAPCTVVSDEVRAKIITPQEVIVPNFKQRAKHANRGLPSALIVTCETGKKRGVASVASVEKQITTATGGGIAAALITVAVSAAVANSTPWIYPQAVNVTLQDK